MNYEFSFENFGKKVYWEFSYLLKSVSGNGKIRYHISSYSFRGNYSFLNLTRCTVTFDHSTYRCGNYSREETIQGRKLLKGGNYMRKYGM